MRTSRKNKVDLLYSLQGETVPIYEVDSEGNVVYEEIDGVQVPLETGESFTGYEEPVAFKGNLQFYTGWNYPGVWGITLGNADAILLMDKNELPINETSMIWYKSIPETKEVQVYDEEQQTMVTKVVVDPESADFSISRIIPSLNQIRYILKGIEK